MGPVFLYHTVFGRQKHELPLGVGSIVHPPARLGKQVYCMLLPEYIALTTVRDPEEDDVLSDHLGKLTFVSKRQQHFDILIVGIAIYLHYIRDHSISEQLKTYNHGTIQSL
jgi:hypothetical protein